MTSSFKVVGRLPTLNEMIEQRARSPHAYNRIKKAAHQRVALQLPPDFPAYRSARFEYHFYEPSRRFDPSNLMFGAVKCIEDALQKAGVLQNDGWVNIPGPDGIRLNYHHMPGDHPWVVAIMEGERDGTRTRSDELRERRLKAREKAKETHNAQHHRKHGATASTAAKPKSKGVRGLPSVAGNRRTRGRASGRPKRRGADS